MGYISDTAGPDGDTAVDDQVFEQSTFASEASDVSSNVDEYVADAIAGESESNR